MPAVVGTVAVVSFAFALALFLSALRHLFAHRFFHGRIFVVAHRLCAEIVVAHKSFCLFGWRSQGSQRRCFFAAAVHFHQLLHFFHRQRNPGWLVDVTEPHHALQHIGFLCHGHAGFGIEFDRFGTGKFAQCFKVIVEFKVETAFQSSALSAQLECIDTQVLIACCCYVHLFKIGEPGAAAELTAAGTDTAQAGSFLSITDMPHFNFYLECISITADEFAEIDALFGSVEKGSLASICLVFHITDLHTQAQLHADAARGFQGVVFLILQLVEAHQFGFRRGAQDGPHLRVILFHPVLFQLQTHEFPLERNDADIETLGAFHYDIITCIQIEKFRVPVELLAASLEANFHDVEGDIVVWQLHVSEPVVYVEFIAATCATGAVVFATFRRATAAAFGSA